MLISNSYARSTLTAFYLLLVVKLLFSFHNGKATSVTKKQRIQGLPDEHTFLGSGSKLGHSFSSHCRHSERSQFYKRENDICAVAVLAHVHAVRVARAAAQHASLRLPLHQRVRAAHAGRALHQLPVPRRQGR